MTEEQIMRIMASWEVMCLRILDWDERPTFIIQDSATFVRSPKVRRTEHSNRKPYRRNHGVISNVR